MGHIMAGHGVQMFALHSTVVSFALENAGIKTRGRTMYARIKQTYGFKGNRQQVFEQFSKYVAEQEKQIKPGEIQKV